MNETEELLSVLSELGITDEQLGMLKDQMKTADELRRYQPATTIQTPGGVVPAYGSMLLGMVERGRAKKERSEAQKGIQEALERQRSGRERFGRALMAPPQPPMGQPPAGPMGPPAPGPPPSAMGPPAPMGPPQGPAPMSPATPPAPMAQTPPMAPPTKRRGMMDPDTAAIIKRLQSYGTANAPNGY